MRAKLLIVALVVLSLSINTASSQDAAKIGAKVGKLKFTDIRLLPRTLDDFGKKKAFVLVFTNTSCPLVKRYLPTLQALEKEYRGKDVQFVAINSADEDSIVAMATQAVQHDMEFPFVKDFGGVCARTLGVRRTPEAVVLDAEHRLVYRGRIDDQYRLGGVRKEPTTNDLKDAIEAVLAGRKVANAETEVDGCPITFVKERKPKEYTFAEHVAPILKTHCWECHQTGGAAPFALTTFKQASSRAEMIAEVVTQQRMPPWFASHEFGPFVNRRGLSDEEREIVIDWARSGAAPGDLMKTPALPKAPESKWLIGTPDLVLQSGEISLAAKGDIPYQYSILPHVFTEDTWVQGVQILPDKPGLLHHGNMGYGNLTEGFNEKNFITGQVPGGEPMSLDPGVAYMIPKGSMLVLQLHFVATGKPEKTRIAVGLRYPREVVQKRLHNIQLTTSKFAIPPNAPAHKVAASRILPNDVVGVGLFAHMHLRGKDMSFTAHRPDGKSDTLLVIPNYSFSWQFPYRWESGKMRLPKGTRLECVAHYDNSPFNPYNPNPLATVRNGPQTYHEMMFGFFFYTVADENLGLTIDPKTGAAKKVDAGNDLGKALQPLLAAESYQFSIDSASPGVAVEAKYQKGAPLYVLADKIEFFRKGDVLVYKQGDAWQRTRTGTLSDPLRILGASAKVRAVILPHEELATLGKVATNVKKGEMTLTGDLDADAAKALARIEDRDLARSGTAKLWPDGEGRLTKYEIAIRVQGRRGNAEVDGVFTKTVAISGVGTTKVDVPAAAKKAID